ncbi:MAG: bifunctional (p)ppGpp synthetase/guanosine-3',5'-bis(diphosphate) 3'-pyrophosphohydrolase [Bacteroidales bacterium]|nr:bifunctional (p)ppGpp synthetase/guanosine-3',5'-bis(diphosphate) 3'-pyrophosphohydrolase [Bacteroidales bacterium]MBN2763107.1 bifunctional (p)ppGpp synthetase/guanosine-3',5'-bis(diphosphate) 3'-pyrophosphohydrolase [Bacteroidales bacterium]
MSSVITAEEIRIKDELNALINNCTRCYRKGDKALIRKAFKIAHDAHKDIRRKSGDPFIMHPLAVGRIVSEEMGLGVTSIVSSLLHDIVEDTDYTLEDITNHFGEKIASIVDGLTKISGVFDKNSSFQAENFRKMLLTLSDDVRVILVKLADRLHNMRTLDALPTHKQLKISAETLYLYAPLAHRMGFYAIKTELEDLSLKYRYPKIYRELEESIKLKAKSHQEFIKEFSKPIHEQLSKNNIRHEINGRYKSIYSIWHKMQSKSIPFEEVYDLMAIRIVFDPIPDLPEKTQCWNIYSMITDIYMPKPERIRDWVSTPKANGYEALHATVMGPKGNWVEIQIRSRRMDEIAERGFAAHWKYKTETSHESELDKWIKRIRELLESTNYDALEFLDDFKLNLFASEIFIFTPKGDIKTLPVNSTVLDFAYEIHTNIGHTAIGAKVNHKLVPLNHVLKSGDQVEIITSETFHPRRDWLSIVITAKAKAAIKSLLKSDTKNRIEKGKRMLEEKLMEIKLRPSARVMRKLMPAYEVANKDELYSKIGTGIILLDNLPEILKKNTISKWVNYWSLQLGRSSEKIRKNQAENNASNRSDKRTPFLLTENIDESPPDYIIAKCCNPIPGDNVVGFIKEESKTGKVIVHQSKCSEAIKLLSSHNELYVPVKWTTHRFLSFLVQIKISGIERFGIFHDITTVITEELNVNIRGINLNSHDGIWEASMELYVHDTRDVNNLIMGLSRIKGVESVERVETVQ